MTRHLDDGSLLEIVYLNAAPDGAEAHLAECRSCRNNLAALRSEVELDRSAHEGRLAAKPEQFWQTQREEIVARAASGPRKAASFFRLRPAIAISILMAFLLITLGLMLTRVSSDEGVLPNASPQITDLREPAPDLFEEDDLRALDPWESEELEPFHQMVEWETWIDQDKDSADTKKEKS